MLDGIEDPFNFGAAVRALYAAGCDGLVVRPRNWMSAAGIVARSSAGATELMPTAVAETAADAADLFPERGLTVACATKDRAVSIYQADLTVAPLSGDRRRKTGHHALLSAPGRPAPEHPLWTPLSSLAGHGLCRGRARL